MRIRGYRKWVIWAGLGLSAGTMARAAGPTLTFHPVSRVAAEGGSTAFSVQATGTGLKYQWRKDGAELPGRTNLALSLAPLAPSDAGRYECVVSNAEGQATHPPATLTVLSGVAPIPTSSRGLRQAPLGTPLSLSGACFGSVPFRYQWTKDGVDVAGATNVTLSFGAITANDAGTYRCRVSNAGGETLTPPNYVVVGPAVPPNYLGTPFEIVLRQGDALPGRTPGRNDGRFGQFDSVRLRDGVLVVRAAYNLTERARYGLYRWANGAASIIADESVKAPSGLNFTNVVYPTEEVNGRTWFGGFTTDDASAVYHATGGVITRVVSVPGGGGQLAARGNTAFFASSLPPEGSGLPPAPRIFRVSSSGALDVVVDGTMDLPGPFQTMAGVPGTNPQFAYDGNLFVFHLQDAAGMQAIFAMPGTGGPIREIANSTQVIPGTTRRFAPIVQVEHDGGLIFSGSTFSSSEAPGFQAAFGVDGTVDQALAVAQWVNAAGPAGYVAFSGVDLTYREGALAYNCLPYRPPVTADLSTMTPIVKADADRRDCAVIAGTTTTSSGARVWLALGEKAVGAPKFAYQPASVPFVPGSVLTFHAAATGGDLSWQWKRDGQPLAGATLPTLSIPDAAPADAGRYTVVVRNSFGEIESGPAVASVPPEPVALPVIHPFPELLTVLSGTSLVLSPNVLDALSRRWFKDGVPISTNQAVSLGQVTADHAGVYRLAASNSAGTREIVFRLEVVNAGAGGDALVIGPTSFADGRIRFSLPTRSGHRYRVESKTQPGDATWATVRTVVGDGTTQPLAFGTDAASGIFRVVDEGP